MGIEAILIPILVDSHSHFHSHVLFLPRDAMLALY